VAPLEMFARRSHEKKVMKKRGGGGGHWQAHGSQTPL